MKVSIMRVSDDCCVDLSAFQNVPVMLGEGGPVVGKVVRANQVCDRIFVDVILDDEMYRQALKDYPNWTSFAFHPKDEGTAELVAPKHVLCFDKDV